MKNLLQAFSLWAIPLLIAGITVYAAAFRRVKVYESFVAGAKEGFWVGVRIIPYLVGILVAIGMFRASGAMDLLVGALTPLTQWSGFPPEALPVALLRPLSGSGTLGLISDIFQAHGPDSFLGRLVSVIEGSTETTFYVLAVYFGSVAIRRTRHALPASLIGDVTGVVAAYLVCRLFFS